MNGFGREKQLFSDVLQQTILGSKSWGTTRLLRRPSSILLIKTAITFNKIDRHRSIAPFLLRSPLFSYSIAHLFQRTCYLRYAEAPTTGIVAAAAAALLPVKYGEKLAAAATAAADSAEDDTWW